MILLTVMFLVIAVASVMSGGFTKTPRILPGRKQRALGSSIKPTTKPTKSIFETHNVPYFFNSNFKKYVPNRLYNSSGNYIGWIDKEWGFWLSIYRDRYRYGDNTYVDDFSLYEEMERFYFTSSDTWAKAQVNMMVENHLLPALLTMHKYYNSYSGADKTYQEQVKIIADNFQRFQEQLEADIAAKQLAHTNHLKEVGKAFNPPAIDPNLDLSKTVKTQSISSTGIIAAKIPPGGISDPKSTTPVMTGGARDINKITDALVELRKPPAPVKECHRAIYRRSDGVYVRMIRSSNCKHEFIMNKNGRVLPIEDKLSSLEKSLNDTGERLAKLKAKIDALDERTRNIESARKSLTGPERHARMAVGPGLWDKLDPENKEILLKSRGTVKEMQDTADSLLFYQRAQKEWFHVDTGNKSLDHITDTDCHKVVERGYHPRLKVAFDCQHMDVVFAGDGRTPIKFFFGLDNDTEPMRVY